MSGAIKSIGKAFKSFIKKPLKILPWVLAAAAVVFTAGAAIPAVGALLGGGTLATGGLTAAAGTLVGELGITGTLGTVLTGALSGAASGAAIGGTLSAITGGKFSKGATLGAELGAVTGGLGLTGSSGLLSKSTSIGATGVPASVDITAGSFGSGVPSSVGVTPSAMVGNELLSAASPTSASGSSFLGNLFGGSTDSSIGGGSILGKENIGGAASLIGKSLLASGETDDMIAGRIKIDAKERAGIGANYSSSGTGLLTKSLAPNPKPVVRYKYSGEYRFDPSTGRMLWIADDSNQMA